MMVDFFKSHQLINQTEMEENVHQKVSMFICSFKNLQRNKMCTIKIISEMEKLLQVMVLTLAGTKNAPAKSISTCL